MVLKFDFSGYNISPISLESNTVWNFRCEYYLDFYSISTDFDSD